MKRFSKIVSVMCEVPSARVISAISCACRSVGKPGNGCGLDLDRPQAGAVARDADAFVVRRDDSTPACASTSSARLQELGPRACEQHLAAGHRHRHRVGAGLDPVGQHARGARRRAVVTPSIDDARGAGAGNPSRPSCSRQSATSAISGSRAAFSITVVPFASVAAIRAAWVPPTVTFGKQDVRALEALGRLARRRSRRRSRSARRAAPAP